MDVLDEALSAIDKHKPKKQNLAPPPEWEIALRGVIEYDIAVQAIQGCNFVAYYGDKIDEMIELVCSIWGKNSLSTLHHIEPGSEDNIIPHLQRANARTISYINDHQYRNDTLQLAHKNQTSKYADYLPGNSLQFQTRNINYLKNWNKVSDSVIFDRKCFDIPTAILWGASPGLDDVIKTIEKEGLWEKVNNSFNIVTDSALPILSKTPLRIDVVSSMDGLPIKEQATIDNMPENCLYHSYVGTNWKILNTIKNSYFLEIDHEANYILCRGLHDFYRIASATDNVAHFAYWFLKNYIKPELILLVGCECCYREDKTHSAGVCFENQADATGMKRVQVSCLDGKERDSHEHLKSATLTWSKIITNNNTFHATLQAAAFVHCITIDKWVTFTAKKPYLNLIKWNNLEQSRYKFEDYELDCGMFVDTLKLRQIELKRVLEIQEILYRKIQDAHKYNGIRDIAGNISTPDEHAITSTIITFDYFDYMNMAEMLKSAVKKVTPEKRQEHIKIYLDSFVQKYLESLKTILDILEAK